MADDRELERKLEAMFASARPRGGFEEELWSRIQGRRPWYRQALDWLRTPAHLAPAMVALVVVAGLGYALTRFHPTGGTTGGGAYSGTAAPAEAAAPAFGVLPAFRGGKSALAVGPFDVGPSVQSPPAVPAPATFLPVYRYSEPTPAELATRQAELRSRTALEVTVTGSDPTTGAQPAFSVSGLHLAVGTAGQAATARAFLDSHGLTPSYAYTVVTLPDRVVFSRDLGLGGATPLVYADGTPAGLEVDCSGDQLVAVRGPLDLSLDTALYPLRTPAAASDRASPARLVYVLVVAGGRGYLEPEQVVSTESGDQFAPAIAPQWLGR